VSRWFLRGLRSGIKTTRYPAVPDTMPPAWRGRVSVRPGAEATMLARGAAACLTKAIDPATASVDVDLCFQCGECARVAPEAFALTADFELAHPLGGLADARERLAARVRTLGRSIMLRHVDAGSDASEEQEVQALFNPYYDVTRLGIFLTASPRHADLLLVTGAVTEAMAEPLRRTYDAMPEPKAVVAVGTSAASGGPFADWPGVVGAVARVLPVDVVVPGTPPAPLSIIDGLWLALGHVTRSTRSAR
jgi:Ni,Fe-hydrogenase III small subunit